MPKKSFQTFAILIALSLLLGSCAASKSMSGNQYTEEPAAMYESYYDFYEAEYGYDEAEPDVYKRQPILVAVLNESTKGPIRTDEIFARKFTPAK